MPDCLKIFKTEAGFVTEMSEDSPQDGADLTPVSPEDVAAQVQEFTSSAAEGTAPDETGENPAEEQTETPEQESAEPDEEQQALNNTLDSSSRKYR